MPEQIAALHAAGHLRDEDAGILLEGAAFLRAVDHAIRLVTGKVAEGLPEHVGHAEAVESLARRWGLIEGEQTLALRLQESQRRVRYVYRRIVESE